MPVPICVSAPVPLTNGIERDRVAAIEGQHAVVDRLPPPSCRSFRHRRSAASRGDRGSTCVGVGCRQDRGARAGLRQRTGAADRLLLTVDHAAAVEHERAVVHDGARAQLSAPAVPDLQRADADRRRSGVGIAPVENHRNRARLCQRARAADRARHSDRVAAIEYERAVLTRRPCPASGGPAVPTCKVPALIVVVPL